MMHGNRSIFAIGGYSASAALLSPCLYLDGVKTRLGTVRTPYEHFYAWRRVNDEDKVSVLPFEEMQTMIKGVYSPKEIP